jgi:hypothetical protein
VSEEDKEEIVALLRESIAATNRVTRSVRAIALPSTIMLISVLLATPIALAGVLFASSVAFVFVAGVIFIGAVLAIGAQIRETNASQVPLISLHDEFLLRDSGPEERP